VLRIALLPGGRFELAAPARQALEAVADVEFADVAAGCDAVLSDRPLPALARTLGHRAGVLAVRPVLTGASPLREERIARADALIVHGPEGDGLARLAFEAAERRRGRLVAVGAWREPAERRAGEHPDVAVESLTVDDAATALILDPARFDVIVCDEPVLAAVGAGITGTPWLLPSATLGAAPPGIFSPFTASGEQGTANPLPIVLAAALLLREGFGMEAEAERLEVAVEQALETGLRTPDLVLGAVGERRAGTEALAAALLSGLE
jgi:isocitrate/isopropylmalate dehydrogenase